MRQHRLNRLSALKVRTLPPGMHLDGGGLYLQVTEGKNGLKQSWIFRYATGAKTTTMTGKTRQAERKMGLGSLDTVSLSGARQKAAEARRAMSDGIDPLAAKRRRRAALALANATSMTFDQCRDAYLSSHRTGWRNIKHSSQWTNTLRTYVTPVFGRVAINDVNVRLVLAALEPIWTTKPETANRVRGRIEAILDWATAREYRTGENPARWKGHLDHILPPRSKVRQVKHHAALPYPELPAFMAELREQNGVAARALEFAILTASRTGEVIGARRSEIDTRQKLWTVPADRMKGHKVHRVPLSDRALALIEGESSMLFPGSRGGLSNMAMLTLLRRMGRADITAHGFRSSFKDWARDRTRFDNYVVEAALAHASGDKIEAAYARSDVLEKRRRLMDAWAAYCLHGNPTAEIVPLRA
jgi:integrase